MSKAKKDTPSGNFQAPPPGAPHQVSQPLTGEAMAAMREKAAQNEQELKPFNPQGGGKPEFLTGLQVVPPVVPAVEPVAEATPPSAEGTGAAEGAEGGTVLETLAGEFNQGAAPVIPDQGPSGVRRPAESNSDSPSRGVPRRIEDPGKVITGGWGEGGGEYFALDGGELLHITKSLFRDLERQMGGDLRFGIATVYPQVRIRVQVLVDGVDPAVPVNEQKFELGHSRILELEGVAMDDQETPADALRDQAGLDKPRKQAVGVGAQRVQFDVPVGR